MITEELGKKLDACKSLIINEIAKTKATSDILKDHIKPDVMVPTLYLEVFALNLSEKKFENAEEALNFMNDIKGIIEKIAYVNVNLKRISEKVQSESLK